jgi:hypothetical protein
LGAVLNIRVKTLDSIGSIKYLIYS